jgi:NAD(P)H-hydrate epimerase
MKILTSAEMASCDRAAQRQARIPSLLLMERAAEGVTELIVEKYPQARNVAVICGPGSNGGDGLAAARLLAQRGFGIRIVTLGPLDLYRGDPKINLESAQALKLPIVEGSSRRGSTALSGALEWADLVVDALFGTGLSRPLSGPARQTVEAINSSGRPVVAVDMPSGATGDSGAVRGAVVCAAWTAAIAALKWSHVFEPARGRCGEIAVVDIGIPDEILERARYRLNFITGSAVAGLFPRRPEDSHKGSFGHVAVVAGSRGKAGAALLAAEGALRAGSGLVTIACPESLESRFASRLPEAMTWPLPETDGRVSAGAADSVLELFRECDSAVVGPGIGTGETVRAFLERIVRLSTLPILIDADALNAFAGEPGFFRRRNGETILTPHPGEAARLLGSSSARVQSSRVEAVREIARRSDSVALLKGSGSLTADPAGNVWFNPTGSAAMATGGSGDLLSGIGAGLLASGLESVDAAVAAAYIHGLAGEMAADGTDRGILVSEMACQVPRVFASFFENGGTGR